MAVPFAAGSFILEIVGVMRVDLSLGQGETCDPVSSKQGLWEIASSINPSGAGFGLDSAVLGDRPISFPKLLGRRLLAEPGKLLVD